MPLRKNTETLIGMLVIMLPFRRNAETLIEQLAMDFAPQKEHGYVNRNIGDGFAPPRRNTETFLEKLAMVLPIRRKTRKR